MVGAFKTYGSKEPSLVLISLKSPVLLKAFKAAPSERNAMGVYKLSITVCPPVLTLVSRKSMLSKATVLPPDTNKYVDENIVHIPTLPTKEFRIHIVVFLFESTLFWDTLAVDPVIEVISMLPAILVSMSKAVSKMERLLLLEMEVVGACRVRNKKSPPTETFLVTTVMLTIARVLFAVKDIEVMRIAAIVTLGWLAPSVTRLRWLIAELDKDTELLLETCMVDAYMSIKVQSANRVRLKRLTSALLTANEPLATCLRR